METLELKNREDLKSKIAKIFNNSHVITDIKEDLEFGNITCTATQYFKNGKIREQIKGMACGFAEDYND